MFVPNFKILSQVVSEKSLTEKKLTDTQTNIRTEKAKTIYPLYTSIAGGIIKSFEIKDVETRCIIPSANLVANKNDADQTTKFRGFINA